MTTPSEDTVSFYAFCFFGFSSIMLTIIKTDWVYTVVAYKYCGTTGP